MSGSGSFWSKNGWEWVFFLKNGWEWVVFLENWVGVGESGWEWQEWVRVAGTSLERNSVKPV